MPEIMARISSTMSHPDDVFHTKEEENPGFYIFRKETSRLPPWKRHNSKGFLKKGIPESANIEMGGFRMWSGHMWMLSMALKPGIGKPCHSGVRDCKRDTC